MLLPRTDLHCCCTIQGRASLIARSRGIFLFYSHERASRTRTGEYGVQSPASLPLDNGPVDMSWDSFDLSLPASRAGVLAIERPAPWLIPQVRFERTRTDRRSEVLDRATLLGQFFSLVLPERFELSFRGREPPLITRARSGKHAFVGCSAEELNPHHGGGGPAFYR